MNKKIMTYLYALITMIVCTNVHSAESNIYKQTTNLPMDKVYPAVYASLEKARFFVVFEPQISKNLQRFAEKWGENHNRSKLDSIRSMVFCHAWYANEVSNKDPDMLALCPLRIGLYEKQGGTTVVFARPSVVAANSPALGILKEVEAEIIAAINQGMNGL